MTGVVSSGVAEGGTGINSLETLETSAKLTSPPKKDKLAQLSKVGLRLELMRVLEHSRNIPIRFLSLPSR